MGEHRKGTVQRRAYAVCVSVVIAQISLTVGGPGWSGTPGPAYSAYGTTSTTLQESSGEQTSILPARSPLCRAGGLPSPSSLTFPNSLSLFPYKRGELGKKNKFTLEKKQKTFFFKAQLFLGS